MERDEDMNVYHEETLELILSPDLSLGHTYPGQRFVAHHEAVEEQYHYEVMSKTESMRDGKGLRTKVIDVPAREAWDEYEECLYYHPFTEEELADQSPLDETDGSDLAVRVQKLEDGKADQTAVNELQEALDMILSGVIE